MLAGPSIVVEAAFEPSLRDFLISRFSSADLRRLVGELPRGGEVIAHLPASPAHVALAAEVAKLVVNYEQLDALRAMLLRACPADADVLAEVWSLNAPAWGPASERLTPSGPPSVLPE